MNRIPCLLHNVWVSRWFLFTTSYSWAARPTPLSGSPPGTRVVVLVDERERQANSNPLSIYLNLHKTLDEGGGALDFACEVRRQSLKLGDFGWALEAADGELRVLPALVERKRIGHRCAEN